MLGMLQGLCSYCGTLSYGRLIDAARFLWPFGYRINRVPLHFDFVNVIPVGSFIYSVTLLFQLKCVSSKLRFVLRKEIWNEENLL